MYVCIAIVYKFYEANIPPLTLQSSKRFQKTTDMMMLSSFNTHIVQQIITNKHPYIHMYMLVHTSHCNLQDTARFIYSFIINWSALWSARRWRFKWLSIRALSKKPKQKQFSSIWVISSPINVEQNKDANTC